MELGYNNASYRIAIIHDNSLTEGKFLDYYVPVSLFINFVAASGCLSIAKILNTVPCTSELSVVEEKVTL